jgi:alkylation response protein AidB-like acyl-CoA dehydrogenase
LNYFTDEPEWTYLFRHAMDWDAIVALHHDRYPTPDGHRDAGEVVASYEELLAATGAWAAETLAPRARELDAEGGGELREGRVHLPEALRKTHAEAAALRLHAISLPREHGGMGAPMAVSLAVLAQISRACLATSSRLALGFGVLDMIARFCAPEDAGRLLPRVARGELSGSMCLTEPHAGSDLGALRTSAEPQPDGTYLLNGSKRFITHADAGLGLVLARIRGAPEGLEGISLFLAEETDADGRRNYEITGIESKMGQRGCVICDVRYDGTKARLVGAANGGFRLMLHLMNAARITVGFQGLGGMEAALAAVRSYAETREQFGKPLLRLPLYARNLADWETERDAFRALMMDTLSHFEIFQRRQLRGLDPSASFAVVRRRTPLVKYYGSEACALISQRAIQALGGYGFMKDYDVERIHRDSFGNLVYEGTSQIQALMSLKDFVREASGDPAGFVKGMLPLPSGAGGPCGPALGKARREFHRQSGALLARAGGLLRNPARLVTARGKGFRPSEQELEGLVIHAETFCQARAYLETLEVLAAHAARDPAREKLFTRYHELVAPRLAGIYADWSLRGQRS